jgi:hypothetical protein
MRIFLFLIATVISSVLMAQEYVYPVAGEFNQAELILENIKVTDTETVVTLSVTNQMESGAWYCADQNIYIYSKALDKKFYITSKENIPTCPEKYEFSNIGEKLVFKLIFPSVKYAGNRIDLIEDCNNSCFYFKDIILDNKLNADIHLFDLALDQYQNKNYTVAEDNFKKILSNIPNRPTHVYGFAYSYLYKIALKKGDAKLAESWKSEFMSTNLPNKDFYLKNFIVD